jgi:UDP-glucose 4-epimerase
MNVVVVGGAGFIGSHLVDRLLVDDHSVDVVDDLSTGGLSNLSDARAAGRGLKFHHLDASADEIAELFRMRRPDVVYHLAAIPRGRPGPAQLADSFAATVRLVESARLGRVPKIVVALPATSLYGRPSARALPLKEQPLEPRGVRGVVARATVDVLMSYRERYAIEFTALALTNVYGRRQRPGGGVVAAFHEAAGTHTSPIIAGDGRQTRDFLFVDDAVDALVRAGERGSGLVVNVGTGEQTSLRDLWTTMAGASGREPTWLDADADDLPRFAVSPVRARIHLSWAPWTSLIDGLAQLD